MNDFERHERFYETKRPLAAKYVAKKLNFAAREVAVPEGPYIVMANHTTDYDPLFLVSCFPRHMYFLASEHVYRMGFLSKLIKRYASPIARQKGASDLAAVKSILGALKKGHNVAFFPEGSRSFNGESYPVTPAAAKLAIKANVPLITFRIRGGYLATPRWARTMRRGKTTGELVCVYTPEEMKALGPDELASRISKDLYVNAYDDQRREPVAFTGEALAEGLEETLYTCPKCREIGKLKTGENRIYCPCGFEETINAYGFFEKPEAVEDPFFEDVLSWDEWQKENLKELVLASGAAGNSPPVLSDPGFTLSVIEDGKENPVEYGVLSMSRDTLSLGSHVFPLASLDGFAIIHKKGVEALVFTWDGVHYQLTTETARSRYKYYELWTILQTI